MTPRICVIPGDGIGREVTTAARRVLQASGATLEYEQAEAGWDCFERHGTALPDATVRAALDADAVLFGAVSSPSGRAPGYRSPIVALRRMFDLYACIRPVVTAASAPAPALIVLRENTEGLYAGRETLVPDTPPGQRRAEAVRVVSETASRRLARVAVELARRHDLGRVTVVHKANVLRETCGLFREVVLDELAAAPDLEAAEGLVDSVACRLATSPEGFGVIVTTNLFGDILSDVAAVHGGGLGLVESISRGDGQALFEPVHGSAPDIAGTGRANPLAAIRAAGRLLEHLSERRKGRRDGDALGEAGVRVLAAVQSVLADGPRTPDLGGTARTDDVTAAVFAALGRSVAPVAGRR